MCERVSCLLCGFTVVFGMGVAPAAVSSWCVSSGHVPLSISHGCEWTQMRVFLQNVFSVTHAGSKAVLSRVAASRRCATVERAGR